MSDFMVSLEQPKDSFANGAYINTIPFGENVFLPLVVTTLEGWDVDENTIANLCKAAEGEFQNDIDGYRETWLTLHETEFDCDSEHTSRIELLAKGERFGNAGYLAADQTAAIRSLATMCNCQVPDLHVTVCYKTFDSTKPLPILIYGYLVMKSDQVNDVNGDGQ